MREIIRKIDLRAQSEDFLRTTGKLSNNTGETLLVYGPKLPNETHDNSLYFLPHGRTTPDNWDCDGFYVPNDRIADQLVLSDISGPAMVKYNNLQNPTIDIGNGGRYKCPANQSVYRKGEEGAPNWEIPDISFSEIPQSRPEVPNHIASGLVPEYVISEDDKNLLLTLKQQLEAKINSGKIIFDAGDETELKKELLRDNSGTKITAKLQTLILELSKEVSTNIRISSLVRTQGHHGTGRAVDIGNESIAGTLLPNIATNTKVAELEIDEIIFDAAIIAGQTDRNKWNYDLGVKHNYNTSTLDDHRNHIHFAVKA